MPSPRSATTLKTRAFQEEKWLSWWTLVAVLALGLLFRLFAMPSEGYGFDVGTNIGWSATAAIIGAGRGYTEQLYGSMLPNYPPLSMLMFQMLGWLHLHWGSSLDTSSGLFLGLMKLPSILADLVTALILCAAVTKWRRDRWMGVAAAAMYFLHPVPIHGGAFWGQTDATYAVFLVATFAAYASGMYVLTGMTMTLGLMTKLQPIACVPLLGILLLRSGWRPTAKAVGGALIAVALVMLPYALSGTLDSVIHVYSSTVGYYTSVSSSAYNFWWSLFSDEAGNLRDTSLLFGLLSYRTIGFLLFGLSIPFPIIVLWRQLKPSPKTLETLPAIFFAATFMMYAFFLWNTQMHERYSFAIVPLGVVAALTTPKSMRLYLLVSGCILLNFLGWLPATVIDRTLYKTFPSLDVLVASLMVILFFLYAATAFDIRKIVKTK